MKRQNMGSRKVLFFLMLMLLSVAVLLNVLNFSSAIDTKFFSATLDDDLHPFNNHKKLDTAKELLESLVVVTGASSNHFRELLSMIGSFHRFHKGIIIFVFNLGLTRHQLSKINLIKNVKIVYYKFSDYPYFADAPRLGGFTFKVHIINKMSKNYNVVLWADTSIRILKRLSENLLKRLLEVPIIAGTKHYARDHSAVAFAKDSTVKYLNMSREDGQGVIGFTATCLIFNFANITAQLLLNKWVDCALHKECMIGVPSHPSDIMGCQWEREISDISFIGCHRYDQAAINLLAIKIFGKLITNQIATPEAEKTFSIERWGNKELEKYIMWK